MTVPQQVALEALLERYFCFLLDAYGVLVDAQRALPGARTFLEELERRNKRYFIVTNDASRLPETCAARYARLGLPMIPPERVLTSGLLLEPHYRERGLIGAGTLVLGPADTATYVERAGGIVLPLTADPGEVRAIVAGDETGFPLLEGLDAALTVIFRRTARGEPLDLIDPNPDLVFPKGPDTYGIGAGSLARLLETASALRRRVRFARLGKPHRPIFDEALRRASCPIEQVVMIGDQLATDIRGANAAGIDSVLVTSGVVDAGRAARKSAVRPTYVLEGLDLKR